MGDVLCFWKKKVEIKNVLMKSMLDFNLNDLFVCVNKLLSFSICTLGVLIWSYIYIDEWMFYGLDCKANNSNKMKMFLGTWADNNTLRCSGGGVVCCGKELQGMPTPTSPLPKIIFKSYLL